MTGEILLYLQGISNLFYYAALKLCYIKWKTQPMSLKAYILKGLRYAT